MRPTCSLSSTPCSWSCGLGIVSCTFGTGCSNVPCSGPVCGDSDSTCSGSASSSSTSSCSSTQPWRSFLRSSSLASVGCHSATLGLLSTGRPSQTLSKIPCNGLSVDPSLDWVPPQTREGLTLSVPDQGTQSNEGSVSLGNEWALLGRPRGSTSKLLYFLLATGRRWQSNSFGQCERRFRVPAQALLVSLLAK